MANLLQMEQESNGDKFDYKSSTIQAMAMKLTFLMSRDVAIAILYNCNVIRTFLFLSFCYMRFRLQCGYYGRTIS
jgi:hypothetical protein